MNRFYHSNLWPRCAVGAFAFMAFHAQAQKPIPQAQPPSFQSAFEGFRPYTDEPMANWKNANDEVGRIGGWRAYTREASEQAAPAQQAQPRSQPAESAKQDPHAGHTKP